MKKIILFLFLLMLCDFCFAFDGTVCIIPENNEIEDYLKMYFAEPEKIKKTNPQFDKDLLKTGDARLLEYLKNLSLADVYIIPITENVSDFTHLSLYIFNQDGLKRIYESLSKNNTVFNEEVLLRMYSLFSDKKFGLVKFTDLVAGTSILVDEQIVPMKNNCMLLEEGIHSLKVSSLGYNTMTKDINVQADTVNTVAISLEVPVYKNLTVESFPEADVLIDGKIIGRTPLEIEEYSVPLILRLQAEGYSDRVVSVSEQRDKLSINLLPITMTSVEKFHKVQNRFYWSFTRTLLLFGGLAGTRASARFTDKAQKGLNYAFYGAIGLSLVDMGFRLYKYFNGIKSISP